MDKLLFSETISASTIYKNLKHLDQARGFDEQLLHVSTEIPYFLEWLPAPTLDSVGLEKKQLLDLYYYMSLTRELDRAIEKLTSQGRAFGKHLMSAGNEATAVGVGYALQKQDWMAVSIRDLGAFLARGTSLEKILATSCARRSSPTGGWDAGLHMSDLENRNEGIISHLATNPAIATGLIFAEEYLRNDPDVLKRDTCLKAIACAFSGEGATSSGGVHEALNIATVRNLPYVFVIENNQWAFGTPTKLQYKAPVLSLRALAYEAEGYTIDGTNVLTVYHVMKQAIEYARKHNQTVIVETRSFRYAGHSIVDRSRDRNRPCPDYMPLEEYEAWKKKDPLITYPALLLHTSVATQKDLDDIHERIKDEIATAEARVLAERPPDATDIERQVYVPSPKHKNTLLAPPREGRRITYHESIREVLKEIMDENPKAFLIGEDIGIRGGAFKITEGFLKRYDGIDWNEWWDKTELFPERRVIDAPLAEKGFCGLALGAALRGLSPIVEFQYIDFMSDADTMLRKWAATATVKNMGPLHIVFRGPAGWAKSAGPYHGENPESHYAGTPGLKIVAPITSFDAKGLLKAAIQDGNPVIFLEYKEYYRISPDKLPPELNTPIPEADYIVPIGKARILKEGNRVSVVTFGSQVFRVLQAVHALEAEHNDTSLIEVIDLRSIIPWDTECVAQSLQKTGKLLVSCEASKTGSFGNTIVAWAAEHAFKYLDGPIPLVAACDTPVPFAEELEKAHLPTAEKVKAALEKLLAY